ncbi:MAG: DUF1612 domain-containing protein [Kiloniellaceae bacterium]
MHATSRTMTQEVLKRRGGTPDWGAATVRLSRRQDTPARGYAVELPWKDFAEAWSQAENALARLEQQLSSSDLRHCWICRNDFEEAAAMLALEGARVAMEDLVMTDAGGQPKKPSAAWTKARALLSLRRHISREGPSKILTCDGILALEARLAAAQAPANAVATGAASLQSRRQRVQHWLDAVDELTSTPALPAAAIALRVWRRMAPLAAHNEEIGLLLAATLLWHWGKTKGLSAGLAVGLTSVQQRLEDGIGLGDWIRRFCQAILLAAESGQDSHTTLARGRVRIGGLLARHRAQSRMPRLAWLFFAYPVIPAGFITRRLQITNQGTDWLLQELIREEIVTEVTGKSRNRAYRLI